MQEMIQEASAEWKSSNICMGGHSVKHCTMTIMWYSFFWFFFFASLIYELMNPLHLAAVAWQPGVKQEYNAQLYIFREPQGSNLLLVMRCRHAVTFNEERMENFWTVSVLYFFVCCYNKYRYTYTYMCVCVSLYLCAAAGFSSGVLQP